MKVGVGVRARVQVRVGSVQQQRPSVLVEGSEVVSHVEVWLAFVGEHIEAREGRALRLQDLR